MFKRLLSRFRVLIGRSRFEREMNEELLSHLANRIDDLVRRGATRDAAARQARLEFGNPDAYKERCRESRGIHVVDDLGSDLRFAFRNMRKHALLSAAVIATLTLGIGISSAVFTFVNADVLRPRVETDAGSFVRVYASYTTDPTKRGPFGPVSLEDYVAIREESRSLRDVAAWSQTFAAIQHDDPTAVRALLVTCNFFAVYGLESALLGRVTEPSDCDAARPVIVLSESIWRSRFAAAPDIIGRSIDFNDQPVTVIGVVRSPFSGQINWASAWLPYTLHAHLRLGPDLAKRTDGHLAHMPFTVDGRLAAGYSRSAAAAELAVIAASQDQLHPRRSTSIVVTDSSVVQEPEHRAIVVPAVSLLMSVLVLVVLLTCANVTTLLLARADERQQEVAVRLSLGAGRRRLVRMLLVETMVLSTIAAITGAYIAVYLPPVLAGWLVTRPLEYPLDPDWRVFLYLLVTTIIAGVGAGLAPSLESLNVSLVESLKGTRRLFGSTGRGARLRGLLVGTQVAVGLVLLLGAGLFVSLHQRLMHPEPGYETRQLLMPAVILRGQRPAGWSWGTFHKSVEQAIGTVNGVRSVAFMRKLPIGGNSWGETMSDIRAPKPLVDPMTGGAPREVLFNELSPGAFDTMGIPIVQGRALHDGDQPCRPRGVCQVVVSHAFVRELLGAGDAVGKTLRTSQGTGLQIVGVARDTASVSFWEVDGPLVYMPWAPNARPYAAIVRFAGHPNTTAAAVGRQLRSAFPGAIVEGRTVQAQIDMLVLGFWRLEALIFVLGGVALVLAMLGIYGVVSFAVSRRTKEMGVRRALGARDKDIYATVMTGSLRPVAIGLGAGLLLAAISSVALGRLIDTSTRPVPVDPRDPTAYCAVTLLLALAALAAMAAPARRAARCAPVEALRES